MSGREGGRKCVSVRGPGSFFLCINTCSRLYHLSSTTKYIYVAVPGRKETLFHHIL